MHRKHLAINFTDLNVRSYIHNLLQGRELTIATMHSKEEIIWPVIKRFLPVARQSCIGLDTDQFGTFTSEILRSSPLDALRQKTQSALKMSGAPLALASEGSFGCHPLYSFLNVNEELVMLTDVERGWEIIGHHMTSETNFNSLPVNGWESLHEFAIHARFPSHGLILKSSSGQFYKDVRTWESLHKSFTGITASGQTLEVFTDMRAMRNPTRMKSIGYATQNLVRNIFSLCPECMMPGFSIDRPVHGLPCRQCNYATGNNKGFILMCRACRYTAYQEDVSSDYADPQFCNQCNP